MRLLTNLPGRGMVDSVILITSLAGHVRSTGSSTNTGPGIPCCDSLKALRMTGTCAQASGLVTLHALGLLDEKLPRVEGFFLFGYAPLVALSLKKGDPFWMCESCFE